MYDIFTQTEPGAKAVPATRERFSNLATAERWAKDSNDLSEQNGFPRKRFVVVEGQRVVAEVK